jgi:multidrug efflux pump subunit AcrA (membrane-fusion protein)
MIVAAGEEAHVRSFPGRVEAQKSAELAFQVPGLLTNFPVKEGQAVKKGELIAQLRQDEFQASLKALQGQLDQARAQLSALRAGERPEERLRRESQVRAALVRLENARAQLDRARPLVASRAVTREAFDNYQTAYRVAQEDHKSAVQLLEMGTIGRDEDIRAVEAQVRGLEGQVVGANINLTDSTLNAPFAGVIAQRFVEQNQNVPAKQPVVRFQDVEEIDIAVDVPETIMGADIQLADIQEITAELSGAPGIQYPVWIREMAQVADPTTQTFIVRVAMQAPAGVRVLPGMTARVTLSYRRSAALGSRIMVPVSAIGQQPGGKQVVWIVGEGGKVSPRSVKVGETSGGQIQIVAGLEPGERIATAGVSFLRDGMTVRDLGDALGGGQS